MFTKYIFSFFLSSFEVSSPITQVIYHRHTANWAGYETTNWTRHTHENVTQKKKKKNHLALGRVLIKLALDFLQLLLVRLSDESSEKPWRTFSCMSEKRIARIARISKNIKSQIYDEFSLSRRGVQFNVTKRKAYRKVSNYRRDSMRVPQSSPWR